MLNFNPTRPLRFAEFVALAALMTSLVAMSIDAMLPALPEIGQALEVQRANDTQLVVSLLFLGLAAGQILYGPLSDSIGRKPAIYLGFGIFVIGSLLSLFAVNFQMMLIGRVLQGAGAAGPRIVTIALVRDQFDGRSMARVMSFVMAVFILVPVIAPSFGQAILLFASWRAIFIAFMLLAFIAAGWFALRQPETLTADRRMPFSLNRIARALREIFSIRAAFGYTVAAGLISGAFIGYLNSSQQIFQELYGLGTRFPLYFGFLALGIGSASFLNGRLVMRFGMRALTMWALMVICGLSLVFLAIGFSLGGRPPLWALMMYLLITFFGVGIQFGNMNALAMEPLGHIAGIGAAVVGSLSTFISLLLGTFIGQSYNQTILPLVAGFATLSGITLLVMRWIEARKEPAPTAQRESV